MPRYRHTQFGIGIVVPLVLVTATVLFTGGGIGTLPAWAVVLIIAVGAVLIALSYAFVVEIDADSLVIRYGVGIVRVRFPLREIETASLAQHRVPFGWNMRCTPYGSQYNLSGTKAVEVAFRSGKRCQIANNRPQELAEAILAATRDL
jgi:hypothetical protein